MHWIWSIVGGGLSTSQVAPQRGAFPLSYHSRPNCFQGTSFVKEAGQNLERYPEFDFNLSTQPAQVSVQHFGSRPGPLMYRETSCPPFITGTYEGGTVMTGRDGPCFGQNVTEMFFGQQQQQLVTAESLNQMRQYKAQLEREIQRITTDLEQSAHVSNQQGEGQSVMPPLMTGHQSLRNEQCQQRTDRSRHHDNNHAKKQSVN